MSNVASFAENHIDQILSAVESDMYVGFCVECGEENYPCEPDMRGGRCESCEKNAVYGAEELLLYCAW